MIKNETIEFLSELKQNNDRDWFEKNKKRYKAGLTDFQMLVQSLLSGICTFDPVLAGVKPADCIFRIFRDVRFAKDKSPYKTNFGANMAPGGKNSTLSGYYIHIDPDESFLAGGCYHPSPEELHKIRNDIASGSGKLKKIIHAANFKNTFGSMSGEQLKTSPRDFPADHPEIELLRYKDFIAVHKIKTSQLKGNKFVNEAMEVYNKMFVFNNYFRETVK
jgi:uncharacterized protein (TIGR02453 family)